MADSNDVAAGGLSVVTPSTAGGVLAAMHGQGAGGIELPKPFAAEPICLIPETRVAGTSHVANIGELVQDLREGQRLRLERDPANAYDHWCIRVLDAKGRRLGFVPADKNEIIARLMDGGKHVFAQVVGVGMRGSWHKVDMGVYLDD